MKLKFNINTTHSLFVLSTLLLLIIQDVVDTKVFCFIMDCFCAGCWVYIYWATFDLEGELRVKYLNTMKFIAIFTLLLNFIGFSVGSFWFLNNIPILMIIYLVVELGELNDLPSYIRKWLKK